MKLVEEGRIGKEHNGTVHGFNLSGLVAQAHHGTADAVTFHHISHTDASSHKLGTVEEVIEDILHSEAKTRGQTCGHKGQTGGRDLEDEEDQNHIQAPADQGNDVVGQVEVDVRFLEHHVLSQLADGCRGLPDPIEGRSGIHDVAENKEQAYDEKDQEQRDGYTAACVFTSGRDEMREEDVPGHLAKVKHVAGHKYGCREGPEIQQRLHRHLEEVVQPGHGNVGALDTV